MCLFMNSHGGLLRIPSVLVVSKFDLYGKSKVTPIHNI
jgi:hypothetical protein